MPENNVINGIVLEFDDAPFELVDISEFAFTVAGNFEATGNKVNPARLQLDDGEILEIEFRVRRRGENTRCAFWKLPLRSKEKIARAVQRVSRTASGNEALEGRTYDELAAGLIPSEASATAAGTGAAPAAAAPQAGGKFKTLATMLLLFGLVGIVLLAVVFLRSRNTLSVSHSALVGNFVPVNARAAGEVAEVFFIEGQEVSRGDVLLRLSNPTLEFEYQQYVARRDAAATKVKALEGELSGYRTKLKIAAQKLDMDLKVASARLIHADKTRAMYQAARARLTPGLRSGAITQLEFDEVDSLLAAAEAEVQAETIAIESIRLARTAIESDVLILGDRVNDEIGRIRSDLDVARGELEQFETLARLAATQLQQLEIRSPRDGRVFASYKQPGEFLKVADEVVAISYPGKVWASGHVTAEQASRVRPGQVVRITVPSMHLELEGQVVAVGHRSVYSKGNYNAEFRGTTATDVPVKVQLADLPEGVPSGIRLEMAITTGFGVKWIDEMMGNDFHVDPVPRVPQPDGPMEMPPRDIVEVEDSADAVVAGNPDAANERITNASHQIISGSVVEEK